MARHIIWGSGSFRDHFGIGIISGTVQDSGYEIATPEPLGFDHFIHMCACRKHFITTIVASLHHSGRVWRKMREEDDNVRR